MLQSIRDHTQGWIAGIIISMLILSFALWGIHSYTETTGSSEVAVKINGQEISKRQVAISYERLRRQLQSNPEALQSESLLQKQVLQSLIELEVLKQAAIKDEYRVGSEQINSFIQAIPEFQVNGRFSDAKFRQLLEANLYQPVDFLELIRSSLLIDQPRLGVLSSSFILPSEASAVLALINQERDVNILNFSDTLTKQLSLPIDKAEIQSYYDKNKDLYKSPEQVSISFVELNLNSVRDKIKTTEDQLQKYYNENRSNFTDAQISNKSNASTAILPYEKVKEQVKNAFVQQRAEELYGELREKLASISYEHPESLDPVAKELGLSIQTTGLFTNDKGIDPLTNNPKIRSIAFSDDVLHKQNNSDVITPEPSRLIVLRVKSHNPARILELKEVEPQITAILENSKRDLKLKQMATEVQDSLVKNAHPNQVMSSELKWQKLGFIKRNDPKVDPAILNTAFSLAHPKSNKVSYGITKTKTGYALVSVQNVRTSSNEDSKQVKLYSDQLQVAEGLLEYDFYKDNIMKNAKIKMED